MKKTIIILSCSLLAIACGNSGESKTEKKDTATTSTATVSSSNEKGLELIGGSDCTTCHRLDQAASGAAIGPAYSEVAKKYSPVTDTTINYLVNKVIKGGSGVWGQTPMTGHPALKEEDVREMVKYVLSLKK